VRSLGAPTGAMDIERAAVARELFRVAALSLVIGCTKPESPSVAAHSDSARESVVASADPAVSAPPTTARLVDFALKVMGEDSVATIEVTSGASVDTIPGLLTSFDPKVTSDGIVHGIATSDDGTATKGYDYNPLRKQLSVFPLPPDLNGVFHEIELNNNAKYLAYVAHLESGQTWAVVRSWPQLAIVVRTPPSDGWPSDVGYDQVSWLDSDHFKLSYRISSGPSILVEGDANARTMKIDTVGTE
jgi:hypothetical protein